MKNMKKLILSFVALALATTAFAQKKAEMMSWDEAYTKADEILKTLTLDEKVEMTRGHNRFFLPGAPAKGLPHVYTVDASAGVRINDRVRELTIQLGIVADKVLQTSHCTCALHTCNIVCNHLTCQIWVLAHILEVTTTLR